MGHLNRRTAIIGAGLLIAALAALAGYRTYLAADSCDRLGIDLAEGANCRLAKL